MKDLSNTLLLPALGAVGLVLSGVQAAQAASAFSSSATLSYTVSSVVNLDHPGDLSGLSIRGSFQQAGGPDSFANTSGNGAVVANNPAVGPVAVGSGFVQSFAVSGSVADGEAHSSHLGLFALNFNNAGADRYAIQATLDYQLSASAAGEFGDTDVLLDYYNADNSFSGWDYVNAAVYGLVSDAKSGSSGVYSFNLAAGGSQALYGDVVITGNVQAVPLPAAAWLFASGVMGVFGAARRRGRA